MVRGLDCLDGTPLLDLNMDDRRALNTILGLAVRRERDLPDGVGS